MGHEIRGRCDWVQSRVRYVDPESVRRERSQVGRGGGGVTVLVRNERSEVHEES